MKFPKIGLGSPEIPNYLSDPPWRFFSESAHVLDGYMELGRANKSLDLPEVTDMPIKEAQSYFVNSPKCIII